MAIAVHYAKSFTVIVQAQSECPLYGIAGCTLLRGVNVLKSMEIQLRSGHSELSDIMTTSPVAACIDLMVQGHQYSACTLYAGALITEMESETDSRPRR